MIRSQSFEARRHHDVVDTFGITRHDVYLNTVPLFHASAAGWARVFLTEGAPVIIAGELPASEIAHLAARHGATVSLMVPPVLASYVNVLGDDSTLPPAPLRALVTGGRQVSPALIRDVVQQWGHILHVYYGTTETGLNTLAMPGDLKQDPSTVGRLFPGNSLAILDSQDRPLPVGSIGTVAISGYMLASRFGASAAPLVHLEEGTYWKTSDTGRIDTQGQLHILGRDLGDNAYDIVGAEGKLRDLPCVKDAYIQVTTTSRPSAVAAYVPRSQDTGRLKEIITKTAAAALGIPDVRVLLVDQIPYSPSGKVRFADFAADPRDGAQLKLARPAHPGSNEPV